jgi:folate-binding protein YgfZ
MSEVRFIRHESLALLEFKGPDAVRFLNGQLTQDVRRIAGGELTLPSCVTDAKGKLQFHVWITEGPHGVLWVEGPEGTAEALEARLTRYLIADDVEALDLTGSYRLVHFIGSVPGVPEGVIARESSRYGVRGTDWWIPHDQDLDLPSEASLLAGDELEAFRIAKGVPLWGRELVEGILPPEAGLDATDISYQKGCYIGQEVISRIKSAGKVNKRLVRLQWDAAVPVDALELVDAAGSLAGGITSVSPLAIAKDRLALGYVKRGVESLFVKTAAGCTHPVRMLT